MERRIAVSVGDPSGIGPEILLKALGSSLAGARVSLFAPRELFARFGRTLRLPLPADVTWRDDGLEGIELEALAFGTPSPEAARFQLWSLQAAVAALRAGEFEALVTAPITKAAIAGAGFAFPGHTEYLAHSFGARRVAMMLAGPKLRVVPLTGHLPLAAVPAALTVPLVVETLCLTAEALAGPFRVSQPFKVALTGLNPHAGEGGLLGEEEQRVLTPALVEARAELARRGVEALLEGPLPADGLFSRGVEAYSAVVCCYHDQALIPVKMRHPDTAVNVTLGLPIVRTSPAHGSALDIAGKGVAREQSIRAALELAVELAASRAG
ncbi:MAG: 4-hydroxythreonine-4-phosphate dehydrogenase PdxA [Deltaproteobacteria bacterium]|nr:4-hydroxythreonine-4-phosphate dehydrogenase PdxA [Deltaproteobacteria bacterium]